MGTIIINPNIATEAERTNAIVQELNRQNVLAKTSTEIMENRQEAKKYVKTATQNKEEITQQMAHIDTMRSAIAAGEYGETITLNIGDQVKTVSKETAIDILRNEKATLRNVYTETDKYISDTEKYIIEAQKARVGIEQELRTPQEITPTTKLELSPIARKALTVKETIERGVERASSFLAEKSYVPQVVKPVTAGAIGMAAVPATLVAGMPASVEFAVKRPKEIPTVFKYGTGLFVKAVREKPAESILEFAGAGLAIKAMPKIKTVKKEILFVDEIPKPKITAFDIKMRELYIETHKPDYPAVIKVLSEKPIQKPEIVPPGARLFEMTQITEKISPARKSLKVDFIQQITKDVPGEVKFSSLFYDLKKGKPVAIQKDVIRPHKIEISRQIDTDFYQIKTSKTGMKAKLDLHYTKKTRFLKEDKAAAFNKEMFVLTRKKILPKPDITMQKEIQAFRIYQTREQLFKKSRELKELQAAKPIIKPAVELTAKPITIKQKKYIRTVCPKLERIRPESKLITTRTIEEYEYASPFLAGAIPKQAQLQAQIQAQAQSQRQLQAQIPKTAYKFISAQAQKQTQIQEQKIIFKPLAISSLKIDLKPIQKLKPIQAQKPIPIKPIRAIIKPIKPVRPWIRPKTKPKEETQFRKPMKPIKIKLRPPAATVSKRGAFEYFRRKPPKIQKTHYTVKVPKQARKLGGIKWRI